MCALSANFSMSGASSGVEQHTDVRMVGAVSEDAAAESGVTMTADIIPPRKFLKEDCVKTVNLAVSNEDVDDAKPRLP